MMAPDRFFACGVLALLLSSVLGLMNTKTASAVDDLWYPGEGVKQDMYVKYRIQEEGTNNGRPFEMTIYFKEQIDDDEWMAPTFVVYDGKVINGTLKLAGNMQSLSGGSNYPPEMTTYISAYHGSLHFLDAFTTKSERLSLNQANWGKVASIGGPPVNPSGMEKVSFAGSQDVCQADSCDATLIMWHKSVDSKVWIVNEFPYPVKAEAYSDVTTGQPPIQFKFELLDTGMGQPEVPLGQGQISKPPLVEKTARGTFEVTLDWEPAEIKPASTTAFGVRMTDSTNLPLERVNYDFTITDSAGNLVQEFKNQNAEIGIATHEVTFQNAGSMTVTVIINSVSGQSAGGGTFTEDVDFNIVVVPEFPVSAAILAALVIGFIVFLSRSKSVGLGGLFRGRNAL